MLSEVYRKYQGFKKSNRQDIEATRQKIFDQIETKTITALKIQNHKVSKIHSNQQQIQNRLRKNADLSAQVKVHLGGWLILHEELNKTLKEVGDIANYAKYIEEQIRQMGQQFKKKTKQQSGEIVKDKVEEEINE